MQIFYELKEYLWHTYTSESFPQRLPVHGIKSGLQVYIGYMEWAINGTVSKQQHLKSQNLYCGLPQGLCFFVTKFHAPGCAFSPWTRTPASWAVHSIIQLIAQQKIASSSDNSRRASIASVVDLPAVNLDCYGLRWFFNGGLILANRMWVKTFPGMDNKDMGL